MSAGYSRWEDAMIAQARILEFYQSHLGRRYLASFFADMNAKHTPSGQRDPRFLQAIQYQTVRDAEPIWVSRDMAELVDHARWSFEPEPVYPSDAFCESGFALLPFPLVIQDMPVTERNPLRSPHGEVPVRAIAWLTHASEDRSMGAYWISLYMHVDDENPDDPRYTPEMREWARRLFPLSLVHTYQWSWFGDTHRDWSDPERYDVQPEDSIEDMMARAKQQLQIVQAFWRLGSQFIPSRFTPTRQIWRDARRKGLKHKDVTVITLRRTKPIREGEPVDTGRRLTVRHWVRGYWGTRHFREGPRKVWIRGHPRGDESLPWQATTRAWEMKR